MFTLKQKHQLMCVYITTALLGGLLSGDILHMSDLFGVWEHLAQLCKMWSFIYHSLVSFSHMLLVCTGMASSQTCGWSRWSCTEAFYLCDFCQLFNLHHTHPLKMRLCSWKTGYIYTSQIKGLCYKLYKFPKLFCGNLLLWARSKSNYSREA